MILAYCVVGVLIVIATAAVVLHICANRHEWCVKVKKRTVVKERVRREALTELYQAPHQQQTIDIGKGKQHNHYTYYECIFTDNSFFESYKGGKK